jgi:hypothetical protein
MRIRKSLCPVVSFVQQRKGWLCNRCIARVVGTTEPRVQQVAHRLQSAQRYYIRQGGEVCSLCGEARVCIRALPSLLPQEVGFE